ncbi:MAG: hypothetical protein JWM71_1447, partial [Solirubrobacteraceae bacterium]|nr:hypothetical protein [Solirubrobacteraceae bacterium]
SATAWNALAVVAAASGHRAQAVRAFTRAKRLSPLGQAPVTLPGPARDRAGPDGGP